MTQRLRYPELAPAGVAAQSAVERYLNTATALPAVLLELVRLRCSLLNGCDYCVALHTQELRRHNEPETRIAALADWRTSDAFTQAERAALRWAEVVTDIQHGHAPDHEFAAVREHFDDRNLVDLTLAIASINAFNRLAIAFRPQWRDAPASSPATDPIADDGGKVSVEP